MERQKTETYFDYLKRMTSFISEGVIDYNKYGQMLLGEDNVYSGENWRKFYYIIKKLIPLIEEDIKWETTNEEQLHNLELKEHEIYKASVKLRDQRREFRKWQTSEARYEHLVDIVKSAVKNNGVLENVKYGEYRNLEHCHNVAVLMLSDWHAGALIDNQFNYYDLKTMEDRAKKIFEKTISYSILHSVDSLYVEINGDMIHGLINVSNRVQSEEDVATQVIYVANILAQYINGLKPYFNKITVITTLGNHGRMFQDKSLCVTKENFEKLIAELLKLQLNDDITLITSQSEDFTKYNINDKMICVAHGQYDKLNTVVQDFCVLFNHVPSEIHLGHTHTFKDIHENNIKVVVNGSLQGTDDYALTLRKISQPSQTLIIYDKDRCVYNLVVD